MKKYLSFAVSAIAILSLGSLTSCHDEDFDVSTTVLKDRAFEHSFIKEFGKPSENQSWDFYSQKLQSIGHGAAMTRAAQAVTEPVEIEQPTDQYFKDIVDEIAYALEELHDNSDVGQNGYDLVSTGDFKVYAVRYAGDIQIDKSQNGYNFEIGYIDAVNNQQVKLFGPGFKDGWVPTDPQNPDQPVSAQNPAKYGNPGWGVEVSIDPETSFYFYLKCTINGTRYTYYSNQRIANHTYTYRDDYWPYTQHTVTNDYSSYGGCSTLLYSAERIDAEAGVDEQVMMIGFEDAWNLGHGPDFDFNDVVLLIEGKLPIPTAKRFFCEDKKSFDWDYNDVVFDVMSTGIVLRAVGGEQPVFLRVTDRLGSTKIYGELHELMLQEQFADNNKVKSVTYKRMKDGEEKTFYKSIDVAGYEITKHSERSVWLDPVQIALWENLGGSQTHQRLSKQEVDNFSVVVNGTYKGKVELIVLDEWAESYDKNAMLNATSYPDFGPLDPDSDIITEGGYRLISLSPAGDVPAMFIAPVSTKWVKELQKITLGYQNFYGKIVDSTNSDGEPIQLYWYETAVNNDILYSFMGDEPD